MTNTNYAKLTSWLVAAWFVFSLAASAMGLFNTATNRPPIALMLSVLVPIGSFYFWYAGSDSFREFILSLSPEKLTVVQTWRIAGITFLALYTYHLLPGIFALPAGWGDILIGATAPLAAYKLANPGHRKTFIAWQLLGITDLVLAIASGALSRSIVPESGSAITTAPMALLPLSVIPTFGVPLFLILHIICIAQARRWTETHAPIGERAGSFAE